MRNTRSNVAMTVALALTGMVAADNTTVTLEPIKDNTLIETADGSLSLGAAEHFYVGRVGDFGGGTLRRGVLAFDVAGTVPEGSVIVSASLTLYMSMTVSGEQNTTMHRLLADWGEGTSSGFGGLGVPATPDDATWLHTFYPDEFWANPGGDFVSDPTAATGVAGAGFYTWQSQQLADDVQAFLDEPESNFGWLLRGNEAVLHTAKQFASRENANASWRPALAVTYRPGCAPADLNCDGVVDVSDLLILLGAWGPCADPDDCPADLTNDGVVDVSDLLILLGSWG